MKHLLPFAFVPLSKTFNLRNSYSQLWLAALLCLPLLGCNSPSTTTTKSENSLADEQAVIEEQELDIKSATVHSEIIDEDEDRGTSLIDSAKADDSEPEQRSPMIAEKRADSTLQATLIGNYIGIIPCVTCDEITLTLNLHSDGTVKQTSIYENPQTPQPPLVETGVYRQDNDMITIVYDKENIDSYRIQHNHLVMVDANKNPNPDYTLSRR